MAGTSLATAQAQLDALNTAYTALASGAIQAYSMPDGRSITYANRKDLLGEIDLLEHKVARLSRGGLDVKYIVAS